MYEKERERRFQYELTKLQVDFEFFFTFLIGLIAILYGLLSFYRDNPLGYWLSNAMIFVSLGILGLVFREKERKFKGIKKKYIESVWD